MSTPISDFRSVATCYSQALKYVADCDPLTKAFLTETVPISLPVKGADEVILHWPRVMTFYDESTPKLSFTNNTVAHELQNVDGIIGWEPSSLLYLKKRGGEQVANRENIKKGILSKPNLKMMQLPSKTASSGSASSGSCFSSTAASSGSVKAMKAVKAVKAMKAVMEGGRKVKGGGKVKGGRKGGRKVKKIGRFAMRVQKSGRFAMRVQKSRK